MTLYFIVLLTFINILGLITMYVDKTRARKHKWRIPEARLFTIALCFGSLGILIGMYLFRHKTKHWKFTIFIPMLLLLNIYLIIKLYNLS